MLHAVSVTAISFLAANQEVPKALISHFVVLLRPPGSDIYSMATPMLWRSTFIRAVPWRACTRITTTRATVAAPLRMARFYSQDRSSGIHRPPGLTQAQQGQEQTAAAASTAAGREPLATSEPTEASNVAAAAPEINYPPKEELTPLAKHIRDSIKVQILRTFVIDLQAISWTRMAVFSY